MNWYLLECMWTNCDYNRAYYCSAEWAGALPARRGDPWNCFAQVCLVRSCSVCVSSFPFSSPRAVFLHPWHAWWARESNTHLSGSCLVPGSVLRPLCALTYVMLSVTQWGRYCPHPLSKEQGGYFGQSHYSYHVAKPRVWTQAVQLEPELQYQPPQGSSSRKFRASDSILASTFKR